MAQKIILPKRKKAFELSDAELHQLAEAADGKGANVKVPREVLGKLLRDFGAMCGEFEELNPSW